MEERETHIVWYRLRGLGLACLCSLLFFCGAYVANQKTVTVNSTVNVRQLPVYCVQTEKKQVALTFDAAWGNEDTAAILSILEKHGVHATFFMTGGWVDSYPEDVRKIAAAGHDLGNHSQNHRNMSQLSKREMQNEIQAVHEKVRELTGIEMKLFRAPYGDYSNELIQTAELAGYMAVQWDVDSEDWKNYGVDSIIQKVTQHKHLGNGSIILMHNGAEYTAAALEAVITGLQSQGYELVPVSGLIVWSNYHMDPEGRQIPET
ncbi:MAG: polysaccharide deacetylase family protein [Candidatus Choladocola sp.]|nr:polysaccharide deacetylase family protein [Candidatus Choladocola sp.]